MKYNFKIVKKYAGQKRFSLRKKLREEENLLGKIINLARGAPWS
ncbi:MAG: hypothetical protein AB1468_06615 [Candidatus Micrarchaeota archaeon]